MLKRVFLCVICFCLANFAVQTPLFAQSAGSVGPGVESTSLLDINLLNQGTPVSPRVWQAYRPVPLPPVDATNGPQLASYIQQGKLALSLSQFLQLVVENNLTLEAARYTYLISQVDLLRARSGQAARGIPSVPVPAGFFAGAIGAGVGNITNVTNQGTGGTSISGNAK